MPLSYTLLPSGCSSRDAKHTTSRRLCIKILYARSASGLHAGCRRCSRLLHQWHTVQVQEAESCNTWRGNLVGPDFLIWSTLFPCQLVQVHSRPKLLPGMADFVLAPYSQGLLPISSSGFPLSRTLTCSKCMHRSNFLSQPSGANQGAHLRPGGGKALQAACSSDLVAGAAAPQLLRQL